MNVGVVVTWGLVALGLTARAEAQQPPHISPQLAAILACRSQPTDQQRLRCFDQAVLALAQAAEQGKIVLVDREDIKRTRRSLFGFSLPKMPFFGGDDSQENEADFIESRVRSARPTGYNKWLIELEDGGTWQTTEPDTRGASPKVGDSVRIRKGAMGSYTILLSRSRPLRGMRVR